MVRSHGVLLYEHICICFHKNFISTDVGSGPLRAERRRREARRETFTTPGHVTARRSILVPPAEGRPGPSLVKSLDFLVDLNAKTKLFTTSFSPQEVGVWPVPLLTSGSGSGVRLSSSPTSSPSSTSISSTGVLITLTMIPLKTSSRMGLIGWVGWGRVGWENGFP